MRALLFDSSDFEHELLDSQASKSDEAGTMKRKMAVTDVCRRNLTHEASRSHVNKRRKTMVVAFPPPELGAPKEIAIQRLILKPRR